jgi:hypothetical protein
MKVTGGASGLTCKNACYPIILHGVAHERPRFFYSPLEFRHPIDFPRLVTDLSLDYSTQHISCIALRPRFPSGVSTLVLCGFRCTSGSPSNELDEVVKIALRPTLALEEHFSSIGKNKKTLHVLHVSSNHAIVQPLAMKAERIRAWLRCTSLGLCGIGCTTAMV